MGVLQTAYTHGCKTNIKKPKKKNSISIYSPMPPNFLVKHNIDKSIGMVHDLSDPSICEFPLN